MSLLISFSASGYVHDKESDLLAILDALIISAKIEFETPYWAGAVTNIVSANLKKYPILVLFSFQRISYEARWMLFDVHGTYRIWYVNIRDKAFHTIGCRDGIVEEFKYEGKIANVSYEVRATQIFERLIHRLIDG